MEWIVRALLVGNAWMASDTHTQQGGADWSLTGYASDVKSVGPNIAFGMVANIINACCYLGAAEAPNYLQTVTMSDLRSPDRQPLRDLIAALQDAELAERGRQRQRRHVLLSVRRPPRWPRRMRRSRQH